MNEVMDVPGKNSIAEKVRKLVEAEIELLNIELVDTEYVKEGTRWFLRLYIDKPGGITIDDCQIVHEKAMDIIDAADPISGPYTFEVSSPGLDRPLKKERDFARNIGQEIEISLYTPDSYGKKAYEGVLISYEDGKLVVAPKDSEEKISFNIKEISLVKKLIKF